MTFDHRNAPEWMQQEAALVRRTLRLCRLLHLALFGCIALVATGTVAGFALQITRWMQ